jgi:four helix bundle protein
MPVARHFSELIVWQLGDQHRAEVFRLTNRPAFHADLRLRSQLDDACDSVCRNVAEGFGCKSDIEFARFVRIGRRSLNEVQDCFLSALHKEYVTPEDLVAARRLQRRLYAAMASLLRSLDRGRRPTGTRSGIGPGAKPRRTDQRQ